MIQFNVNPAIPYFNVEITKGEWTIVYPANVLQYNLREANGFLLKEGTWNVPTETIDAWGTDDSVITNALLTAAPWEIHIS